MSAAQPGRGRGRPRSGARDTRELILRAAAIEFETNGYDAATMRAIAARAGVDAALIHHHFGSKADLFGAVIDTPVRPDLALGEILAGSLEGAGEKIVAYVLETWDDPAMKSRGVALIRAALGSKITMPLARAFLSREVVKRIATAIGGLEGERRAGLVVSQVSGLIVSRYVLRLPAIAETPAEAIIADVGATIQRYLTGELHDLPASGSMTP